MNKRIGIYTIVVLCTISLLLTTSSFLPFKTNQVQSSGLESALNPSSIETAPNASMVPIQPTPIDEGVVTSSPMPSDTPTPSDTSTPGVTPTLGITETPSVTPTPGNTPKPVSTSKPTATPTVKSPSKPTITPKPKPTPTPIKASKELFYSDKVTVLMYHNFDDKKTGTSISGPLMEAQFKTLLKHNFHFISMQQFLEYKLNKGKVPVNAVLVTFDDGYEDFYTVGLPLFKKYKIPATNFIIVKATDKRTGWSPHLTWEQMRAMTKEGMSFYSHTYDQHYYIDSFNRYGIKLSGPALTTYAWLKDKKRLETSAEYRGRVLTDLAKADSRIRAELKTKTNVLSFPYGAYNEDLMKISSSLGHKLQVTIQSGVDDRMSSKVKRINAGYKSITGEDLIKTIKNALK